MVGCKHVATLLATDGLGRQSGWPKFTARLHLAVCRSCRGFARQLEVMRQAAATIDARYQAEVGSDFVDRVHEKLTR
jgi:hypothetical protein